jgi:hypothetical protein
VVRFEGAWIQQEFTSLQYDGHAQLRPLPIFTASRGSGTHWLMTTPAVIVHQKISAVPLPRGVDVDVPWVHGIHQNMVFDLAPIFCYFARQKTAT